MCTHIREHCPSLRHITFPYECATTHSYSKFYTNFTEVYTPIGIGKWILFGKELGHTTIHLEQEATGELWRYVHEPLDWMKV